MAPKSEISHTYKYFNTVDFKRKYSKIPCIPDNDMQIFFSFTRQLTNPLGNKPRRTAV